MGESIAELKEYREKVIAELERRMNRLNELDARLQTAEFDLEVASRRSSIYSGGTARIQVEAAHRARLRDCTKQLAKERVEAYAELKRAEERLSEVDERLTELEAQL